METIKQEKSKSYQEFEKLLKEEKNNIKEGAVTNAVVQNIGSRFVEVYIPNSKQESYIPVSEFINSGQFENLKISSEIPVLVESKESAKGNIICSFELARKKKVWNQLKTAYDKRQKVFGRLLNRVKSGWAVNLDGCMAFLPNSCLDLTPLKSVDHLLNKDLEFFIEKMSESRGNIIVSRRAVLSVEQKKVRDKVLSELKIGDIINVKLKSIVSFGCFCTYKGIDLLLHLTQISYGHVEDPRELLNINDEIRVKVIEINDGKISVSIKALSQDPWNNIDKLNLNSTIYSGRCLRTTTYGAFVEFDDFKDLIGLVYRDELSHFDSKNKNVNRLISKSQTCKFKVIAIDKKARKLSLSMRAVTESPWEKIKQQYPVNSKIKIDIVSRTDYAIFGQIQGSECVLMVHKNELHYYNPPDEELKKYRKGMTNIDCIIKEIFVKEQKIRGSIRETNAVDPFATLLNHQINDTITCVVSSTVDHVGVNFRIGTNKGFEVLIKRKDLAKNPQHQRISRFVVGDRHDAQIISLNKRERKCSLSICALEEKEEKSLLAKFKNTASGDTLRGILGPILEKKKENKKK